MPNNPYNIESSFTHWLLFKSLGHTERYQISAPPGFPDFGFSISQEDGRFGVDKFYANESMPFTFYKEGEKELIDTEQVTGSDGIRSKYLDYGYHWIYETWKRFGTLGVIEYHLDKDGASFMVGIFDMPNLDTDGATYFKIDIIQNTKKSNFKKRFENNIDIFGTKDFNGNTITPAPTMRYLYKTPPELQVGFWKSNVINGAAGVVKSRATFPTLHTVGFNINEQQSSELENTLSYNNTMAVGAVRTDTNGNSYSVPANPSDFQYAVLKNDYKDLTIELFSIIGKNYYIKTNVDTFTGYVRIIAVLGNNLLTDPFTAYPLYEKLYTEADPEGVFDYFPESMSINIPFAERGKKLYIFMSSDADPVFGSASPVDSDNIRTTAILTSGFLKISASAIFLDNVINVTRYIDVMKQCSKNIVPESEYYVDAPMFEQGGEHFNNVCWNRALLSMKTSSSLKLLDSTTPEGTFQGEVVTNTNTDFGAPLSTGMYFWDGSGWVNIDTSNPQDIDLEDSATPAGSTVGELRFNNNEDVEPVGLCFWNGGSWQSLQYNRPFITTPKNCFGEAMTYEECGDYEIQDDKILVQEFDKYYEDVEIGAFLIDDSTRIDPETGLDKSYTEPFNPRFKINSIMLGYDEYETNRLSKNSRRDIHTEAEWSVPNPFVQDKLERSVKYIRSSYLKKALMDLEIKTPATADENDDKVFIERATELPTGTICEFTARLNMTVIGGQLHLYNADSDDNQSVVINWNTRGLIIGQLFTIVDGDNDGDYNVVSYTNTELILSPIGFTPAYSGNSNIKVSYEYLNILLQTETDEEITATGLYASNKYPDLYYTVGRMFEKWKPYIASALIDLPDDAVVKLQSFVNTPTLTTQKGSDAPIKEVGKKPKSSFPRPILGNKSPNLWVHANFKEVLDLMNATSHGWIRCYSLSGRVVKGFPTLELTYDCNGESLKLRIEELYSDGFIKVLVKGGQVLVNNMPYETSGLLKWYRFSGEYLQLFDTLERPICEATHYSKILVEGLTYDSVVELKAALDGLI